MGTPAVLKAFLGVLGIAELAGVNGCDEAPAGRTKPGVKGCGTPAAWNASPGVLGIAALAGVKGIGAALTPGVKGCGRAAPPLAGVNGDAKVFGVLGAALPKASPGVLGTSLLAGVKG